jgi:hypothetical protein
MPSKFHGFGVVVAIGKRCVSGEAIRRQFGAVLL